VTAVPHQKLSQYRHLLKEVTDKYELAKSSERQALLDDIDTAAQIEQLAHDFKNQRIRDWFEADISDRVATAADIAKAARLSSAMVYRIAQGEQS
jgi:hypothetical protein